MFNPKTILEEIIKNTKSEIEVKKYLKTTKDIHLSCLLSRRYLTPQSYGPLLEGVVKRRFDFIKETSKTAGDLLYKNISIEVKVSLEGCNSGFNFVQIRPSYDVDVYLLVCYGVSSDTLYFFMIPSLSMKTLIEHYGSYAHGTIKKQGLITKDNIENNDYEYCLRPKFNINDALWKELNRYICYEEQLIYKLEGYNGEKEYS